MNKRKVSAVAIKVAASAFGAAALGPLGQSVGMHLGGLLGDLIPAAADKLLQHYLAEAGEKGSEELAKQIGDSLSERLRSGSLNMDRLLIRTLKVSLSKLRPLLSEHAEWFQNWDAALSSDALPELDWVDVQTENPKSNDLSRFQTLDAFGGDLRRHAVTVTFRSRPLPEDLKDALATRLPLVFDIEFVGLITQKGYEQEWKSFQLLTQREQLRRMQATADDLTVMKEDLRKLAERTVADTKPEQVNPNRLKAILPRSQFPIGRTSEIEKGVEDWLSSPERLLLICGQPGIGKSTIGRAILRHRTVEERFGDRRFELHCDDISSVGDLVNQLSSRWFNISPAKDEVSDRLLRSALEQAPTAIFIDNLETLAFHQDEKVREECEEFLANLAAIKDLYVLVGCQKRRPPAPQLGWIKLEPGPLGRADARTLLLRSAEHKRFAADPALDDLVDALDGVPHALELIGRVAAGHQTLGTVLALWRKHRLKLVSKRGQRSKSNRRAENIEISYNVAIGSLSLYERRALRMLAELPSGMLDNDARALLPNGDVCVSSLERAAVCSRSQDLTRLLMLSPLRAHVQRVLALSEGNRAKLVSAFLSLSRSGAQLESCSSHDLVSRLQAEEANLTWAVGEVTGKDKEDIEAVLGLGAYAEHVSLDVTRMLLLATDWIDGSLFPELKAEVYRRLASLERVLHKHHNAFQHYSTARILYEQLQDSCSQAWCDWGIGDTHTRLDEYPEAKPYFENALRTFEQVQNLRGVGWSLQGLGDCFYMSDPPLLEEAREAYEAAQPLLNQAGDLKAEAWCFRNMGQVARLRKDFRNSAKYITRSIDLFDKAGDPGGVGGCLWDSGMSAINVGELDSAAELFRKGKIEFEKAHDLGEAWCIRGLAEVAEQKGQVPSACSLFRQARRLFHMLSNRRAEAGCLFSLGCLITSDKSLKHRRFLFNRAREISRTVKHVSAVQKCDQALERLTKQEQAGVLRPQEG